MFENRDGKASYDKNTYNKLKQEGINNNPELKNQLHPIMGNSEATKQQMIAFYNAHAKYPDFYKNTEASTLDKFVQMYIDECKAEGVKPEVAFAQAMHETAFLKYGGDVKIEQFNFGGLGATGGVPGNSFPDIRTGVRAQIQHLKAYASTAALKNKCVDERFKYITRGCAPYIEYLSSANNPNGKGWAKDPAYAEKINKYVNEIKSK